MPHITIQSPALSLENKRILVDKITEAVCEAYNISKEKFLMHLLEFSKKTQQQQGFCAVIKSKQALCRKAAFRRIWGSL